MGEYKEPPVMCAGPGYSAALHVSVAEVAGVEGKLSALSLQPNKPTPSATAQLADGSKRVLDVLVDDPGEVIDGSARVKVVARGGDSSTGVSLRLKCEATPGHTVVWNVLLLQDGHKLLLHLPDDFLSSGSRESLVTLLDYAEAELKCTQVIVSFSKARRDRQDVVRMFMYLGFTTLDSFQSVTMLHPSPAPDHLTHMCYEICQSNGSEDDDEDD